MFQIVLKMGFPYMAIHNLEKLLCISQYVFLKPK